MCCGDGKNSGGDSQYAPRPVRRVPLSIERPSRVAVPAQARPRPPQRPVNQTHSKGTTQRPVNTYMQPNPWPPELVLEHANYKAADSLHGAASTRYRRERGPRESEVTELSWTSGRNTYAPGNLTPESHYELLPMAVDWKDKAQTHCELRQGFDDAHPRAYKSPEDKQKHRTRTKQAKTSVNTAGKRVAEHELNQGNFMQSDPYDSLDWATAGSSSLPNGQRRSVYDYDR